MATRILHVYGSSLIHSEYCPFCKQDAFILHNKFSCCDRDAPKIRHDRVKVEVDTWYKKRKKPSKHAQERILKLQNNRCFYCDDEFGTGRWYGMRLRWVLVTWDHVLPFSYNGNNEEFVAACRECNCIKSNLHFADLEEAKRYLRGEMLEQKRKHEVWQKNIQNDTVKVVELSSNLNEIGKSTVTDNAGGQIGKNIIPEQPFQEPTRNRLENSVKKPLTPLNNSGLITANEGKSEEKHEIRCFENQSARISQAFRGSETESPNCKRRDPITNRTTRKPRIAMNEAKVISIYCDSDFHCKLRARAASQGRSVSRHVRWLIETDLGIPHPNVVNRASAPREEDIPRE